MVTVPSFLLKRLYVKGSLRNNEDGFQLELKNSLGSGYSTELQPLGLDGKDLPLKDCYYRSDSQLVPFAEVSKEKHFTLAMNKALTILVKGIHLTDEPHKVKVCFVAEGIGKLSFEVTDEVAKA